MEAAANGSEFPLIDCHVHMLPGVDDGARSLDQALEMARLAVADGIGSAVLTPHHYNGSYTNPTAIIQTHIEAFRAELTAASIPLEVHLGSEIHLVPELPQALADGTAMTFAGRGKSVLVELPFHHVPRGAEQILETCLAQGITPVIAHPERNTQILDQPELLQRWVEMGCLAQVTVQSCTGRFGTRIEQGVHRMIDMRIIHIAASDGHRPYRRQPQISQGRCRIAEWTNPEVAALLTSVFPSNLVAGEALDTGLLTQTTSRPWWSRWRG